MSTHSAIIQKTETGYKGIYCHWDGYPEGVGVTLLAHYNDEKKVSELISLGDVSNLCERIIPNGPHSFDKPETGCTVFYGRDRGEENVGFQECGPDSLKFLIKSYDHDYAYVFENGKWTVNGKDLQTVLSQKK